MLWTDSVSPPPSSRAGRTHLPHLEHNAGTWHYYSIRRRLHIICLRVCFPRCSWNPIGSISHWLLNSRCEHSAWHPVGMYLMLSDHPDSGGWRFWVPTDKGIERKAHGKTARRKRKEQRIWKDPRILFLFPSCFYHLGQITNLTFCYPWNDNTAFLVDFGERIKWYNRYENASHLWWVLCRNILIVGKKYLYPELAQPCFCVVPSHSIWMTRQVNHIACHGCFLGKETVSAISQDPKM